MNNSMIPLKQKPSFEEFNYALRPNKNVERKMVMDCLLSLKDKFGLHTYRYIGFGSMWFCDFILAHKMLGINELISIEIKEHAERALFNRPYKCIKVMGGMSSDVLEKIGVDKRKSIVWLDYDSKLGGPVLKDLQFLCRNAKGGTFLIATVNAHVKQLDNVSDIDGNQLYRLEALEYIVGDPDLLPTGITSNDLTIEEFPSIVSKILFERINSSIVKSGRSERFLPIFNISYADSTPMVTVGGIIGNGDSEEKIDYVELSSKFYIVKKEDQVVISVPPLTQKEKLTIDQLFPSPTVPTEGEMKSLMGFSLRKEILQAYRLLYLHYPTFGEVQP